MNIETIRSQTKGLDGKLFFNSAGSSLMQDQVIECMLNYLEEERMIGGYAAAAKHQESINGFYTQVANLIKAKEKNIAFATSATDAYNQALSSIPFQSKDVILTTNNDYISNQLAFIGLQKRYDVEIVRVNDLKKGGMDAEDCIEKIEKLKPKLVAITHIPTNSGLIQDVYSIAPACKASGAYYLIDTCQSIGQLNISVETLNCDFLTATGRKFMRGPRGTGFLYVSDRVLNEGLTPLFTEQCGAEWTEEFGYKIMDSALRFERWERNCGNMLGLAKATELINKIGIESIEKRNNELQLFAREALSKLPNIQCTDIGENLCNLITFTNADGSINRIVELFATNNVSFSISGINSALIDFTKRELTEVVRISPHYFNTEKEISTLIDILKKA
jgi:selenocysteine lyase/cysteine desulfurase